MIRQSWMSNSSAWDCTVHLHVCIHANVWVESILHTRLLLLDWSHCTEQELAGEVSCKRRDRE